MVGKTCAVHVHSKTDVVMKNGALCKFLCHNIVVVHQSQIELGIEPVFWGKQQKDDADGAPVDAGRVAGPDGGVSGAQENRRGVLPRPFGFQAGLHASCNSPSAR